MLDHWYKSKHPSGSYALPQPVAFDTLDQTVWRYRFTMSASTLEWTYIVATLVVACLIGYFLLKRLMGILPMSWISYITVTGLYADLIVLFSHLYHLRALYDATALSGSPNSPVDYLYFSIATITTTGYGDILPKGQVARMLASAEMLIGLLFNITFFALVSTRLGNRLNRTAGR